MIPQRGNLFLLFLFLGSTWIVNGRRLAAREIILEKRQMDVVTVGDAVTEVFTQVDTVVSPGTTKVNPVTLTRSSTSQVTLTKTPTIVSSTPPTSLAPTSTSGFCDAGYTLCAASLGGGCCKNGYTCGGSGCTPPTGTTLPPSRTCTVASQSLCASSMGYGCCNVGQECGFSSCTPTVGPAITKLPDVDANNLKKPATATSSSSPTPTSTSTPSKGLTKIAIGGIVGGIVVALIALGLAWIFARKHIENRSNTDAAASVPTTNHFDPTATLSGQHMSNSSRYRNGMSQYRPPQRLTRPAAAMVPPARHSPPPVGGQGFDFGLQGDGDVDGGGGYGYHPVPLSDNMPAELGSSSVVAPGGQWGGELPGGVNEVHEVEGDAGRRTSTGNRRSWFRNSR